MASNFSRRDALRLLGAGGFAALTNLMPGLTWADDASTLPQGFHGSYLKEKAQQPTDSCPKIVDGKVVQPQRELSVLHTTDVLVIGGGPAGVCAALAAKRAGASVTIVERYGHFGGLWTGGLVLVVLGHIVKGNKQVVQGVGEEIMKRLDKTDGGIINRRPGVNPTVDAEVLKYVMVDMITENKIDVFLHCWGVDAIMDGQTVRGAVFESKSGRQAIIAKTVIDATGDGDILAAAGAQFDQLKYEVGLVSRLGNIDKIDAAKAPQGKKIRGLGSSTPAPGINWVNMLGPAVDGIDVAELTRLELNHRKAIWKSVERLRSTPGHEKVFLVETAPQMGVRMTRTLVGTARVNFKDFQAEVKYPDVIGVGGSWNASHQEWQIPYGALLPAKVDNLLAAGRCISTEIRMADLVRVIPNCFVSGQGAGVAAAVAVRDNCRPRNVDVPKVQRILKEQDVYLG